MNKFLLEQVFIKVSKYEIRGAQHLIYRKIPITAYICSKGFFAGLIFWGACFQSGLLLEGILHFKMGGA